MRFKTISLSIALVAALGCSQAKNPYDSDTSGLDNDSYAYGEADFDPAVLEVESSSESEGQQGYASQIPAGYADDSGVAQQGPQVRIHVVKSRDTLYGLARTYYNDARQWKRIFEANRALIKDPDKIFVGMELVIP